MVTPKKTTTYRLTQELDDIITEQARKLGISKNAFVQKTLAEVLTLKANHPTGTEGL